MIHRTLEQRLDRAAGIWKWQAVIKSTALIVSIVLLVVLATGVLVQAGWIGARSLVLVVMAVTFLVASITWLVSVLRAVERKLDRQWLAEAVEREQSQLMDRFNAVVELDERPWDTSATMYRDEIEGQASRLIRTLPRRSPFSWTTTAAHVVAVLTLIVLTVWYYRRFEPLQPLATITTVAGADRSEESLTIPEIEDEEASQPSVTEEAAEPWGQIRISQPGRDLRITRHEEIPLLIEAAADRPLTKVAWSTSINLDAETEHELAPLRDPRYAVFQPMLSPTELGAQDWDLVHYQAAAIADDQSEYQSASYFVEVIPSRNKLDKLSDSAYQHLEDMSRWIRQQQEVIHQTDRLDAPASDDQTRRMDALAEQENRLLGSVERFRAALPQRLATDTTEPFDTAIASARDALQQAETALREHDPAEARPPEKEALTKLVEARRHLADLVGEHPEAFKPSALAAIEKQRAEGVSPTDSELTELLGRLDRESQQVSAAAAELESVANAQQKLVDQAHGRASEPLRGMAPKERRLGQQLQSMRERFPAAFEDLTRLSEQTETALENASERLRASRSGPQATEQAYQSIRQLADALTRRQMANELAQSQLLKQRLDTNRKDYRKIEDHPQQSDAESLKRTTEETRDVVEELQQLATDQTRGQRESELARKLSPEAVRQIMEDGDAIGRTEDPAQRTELAHRIGETLESLSQTLAQQSADQESRLDQQRIATELEQMRQQEEGFRSARQSVQQALLQQRSIQRSAFVDRKEKKQYSQLAQRQLGLQQKLQQAMDQDPQAFERASGQCQSAKSAMQQTARSLNDRGQDAAQLAGQAAEQLQNLDQALEQQQQQQAARPQQQRVSEMLEQLNQRLESFAKHPDQVTAEQQQRTAGQCKSVGSKACQMAGQASAGSSGSASSSGSPAAVGGEQQGAREQQIASSSDRLASAQRGAQLASAATDLREQLQQLAGELGGQPRGSQSTQGRATGGRTSKGRPDSFSPGQESLRSTGTEAIERGLSQLESAVRRGQQGTLTADASESLQRGGMAEIRAGIRSHYGYNENSRVVIGQLAEYVPDPSSPVDARTLQQLREQIQSLQQDLTIKPESPAEPATTLQVDPARFPPDYEDSIKKYFETLSEQP